MPDNRELAALIWLMNLYVMSLPTELVMQFVIIVLSLVAAVGGLTPEHKPAKMLCEILLAAIGFALFIYTVRRRLLDTRPSDRDRDDARTPGRGPGDSRQSNADGHSRDPRDDARWPDRDREPPDRAFDPREPFTRDLHLPRGLEREIVRDRDREYTLRGSETRTLATVGAFRVVFSRDLRDYNCPDAKKR